MSEERTYWHGSGRSLAEMYASTTPDPTAWVYQVEPIGPVVGIPSRLKGSRAVQCERHDACERPDSHRGKCDLRMCASEGCPNPARNSDERFCSRHEDRATYERYWTATGEADRLRGTEEKAEG